VVSQGVPRFRTLIDMSSCKTPIITIYLNKDVERDLDASNRVCNRIVQTRISDCLVSSHVKFRSECDEDMIEVLLACRMDRRHEEFLDTYIEIVVKNGFSLVLVSNLILEIFKFRVDVDLDIESRTIRIYFPSGSGIQGSDFLTIKNKIEKVIYSGVSGISTPEVVKQRHDDGYVFYYIIATGTNMLGLLDVEGIDFSRTVPNDVECLKKCMV